MKNHSMLTPFFFIFLLFFINHHITVVTSTPPYIAVDNIALNCGSFGNSKATDKRDWIGDKGSKYSPMEQNNESNSSKAQRQASSVEPIPYSTARLSYSQFTYVFPVTPGPKFVRLYFYSAAYLGFTKSKDFFTVKAGSFTLLRNFSASIYTDSSDEKYFVKEFCINVEKNKKLNLTFIPFKSGSISYYAFINGIEVVSMPKDYMYYTSSSSIIEGKVPVYVGQALQFYINYSMALEMVYRLNIGGSSIPQVEDTGMFRQWSEVRTDYLLTDGVNPRDPSLKLKYSKIPKYIAPDTVYQSAVSMGPNSTRNSMSNLTWGLPVETGFNYLVRLHFCEIDSKIHVSGTRVFAIYVDYQLAEETADVISWADNSYTPYYKDYVVMIQNKGEDSHTLAIDLHPSTDATFCDAILNGVEVFKLSDLSGNLAGLNMVPPPMDQQPALAANKSNTKKTIFIAIGSGVGFLVVAALVCFMVLCKLKMTERYGSCHPLAKWWRWFRPDPYKREFSRRTASSLPGELCHYFRLDEIKTATNNFNEDLIVGVGGFGNVYKGLIEQGNE